jgi:tRNA (mo5U34)-methyltransferase
MSRLEIAGIDVAAAADYCFDRLFVNRMPDPERQTPDPRPVDSTLVDDPDALLELIKTHPWFHCIRLRDNLTTEGVHDHGKYLHHFPIPSSLKGKRVLDVATADGFWAFEFERRGASEVLAVDIGCIADADLSSEARTSIPEEWLRYPLRRGFDIAKAALRSNARRDDATIYDICPQRLGTFDFVFSGDVLSVVQNPVQALRNLRSVTAGELLLVDMFNPTFPETMIRYRGFRGAMWWSYGLSAIEQMLRDAGFRTVERLSVFKIGKRGEKPWMWHAAYRAVP